MGTGRSQRGYPEAAPASSAVEAASAPPWSHHLPSIGPSSRSQQHPRDACTRALLYRTYGGLHRLLARRARVTKSSRFLHCERPTTAPRGRQGPSSGAVLVRFGLSHAASVTSSAS